MGGTMWRWKELLRYRRSWAIGSKLCILHVSPVMMVEHSIGSLRVLAVLVVRIRAWGKTVQRSRERLGRSMLSARLRKVLALYRRD